jgi:hypothetical protein
MKSSIIAVLYLVATLASQATPVITEITATSAGQSVSINGTGFDQEENTVIIQQGDYSLSINGPSLNGTISFTASKGASGIFQVSVINKDGKSEAFNMNLTKAEGANEKTLEGYIKESIINSESPKASSSIKIFGIQKLSTSSELRVEQYRQVSGNIAIYPVNTIAGMFYTVTTSGSFQTSRAQWVPVPATEYDKNLRKMVWVDTIQNLNRFYIAMQVD